MSEAVMDFKLKYVFSFKDRHGHLRYYFRRGKLRIPLPDPGYGEIPSGAFTRKYQELLGSPVGSRATPPLGTIYVAGFAGYVKIGFSRDALKRISQLQVGCPEQLQIYLVVEGTRGDEQALHKRFGEYRLLNEWFRCEGRLAQWLLSQKRRVDEAACKPVDADVQTPSLKSMA